ncbi:26S proteasome non-ATPase regulatory subunit 1 homolog A, partial [Tanacetum coccineum]
VLALGIALMVYGREEQAYTLIEEMAKDKDPLIHVKDDVKRSAVLAIGFVMYSEPEQTLQILSLLSTSYNPHIRYGAAMAVGISCAGAYIAMAMVMIQTSEAIDSHVGPFRRNLEKIIRNAKEDTMSKMGAILATGIINAGGRNVRIKLRSNIKHNRMSAVIGLAVFSQYCQPSLFAYPEPTPVVSAAPSAVRLPTAVLSTSARAKAREVEKATYKKLSCAESARKGNAIAKKISFADLAPTSTSGDKVLGKLEDGIYCFRECGMKALSLQVLLRLPSRKFFPTQNQLDQAFEDISIPSGIESLKLELR